MRGKTNVENWTLSTWFTCVEKIRIVLGRQNRFYEASPVLPAWNGGDIALEAERLQKLQPWRTHWHPFLSRAIGKGFWRKIKFCRLLTQGIGFDAEQGSYRTPWKNMSVRSFVLWMAPWQAVLVGLDTPDEVGRLWGQIIDKSTNGDFELSGNGGGSAPHAPLHVALREEGLEERVLGLEHHRGEIALQQVWVLRHETLHGVRDRTRIVFYPEFWKSAGREIMVWRISWFLHHAWRMNEFLMVKQHESNKWSTTMQTSFIRSQCKVLFLFILFSMLQL